MAIELDSRKVKKGWIHATFNIPISYDNKIYEINFAPKTITKIILTVELTAGSAMTITINGLHDFPVAGNQSYEVYSNVFSADGVVEIIGSNFSRYDFTIQTDGTTTGKVYAFYEYDYDLIK